MLCVLCGADVNLLDLDVPGWNGEPAHTTCAAAARQALSDANAMVMAEPDPKRHRNHLRPVAAA